MVRLLFRMSCLVAKGAKAKGSTGERELCRIFEQELLLPEKSIIRNLEQVRDGSSDIVLPGYMIEVKRHETLTVPAWWEQVCTSALKHKCFPILAYRRNRQKWFYCIPAAVILPGDWRYITMCSPLFFDWFRARIESLGQYEIIRKSLDID